MSWLCFIGWHRWDGCKCRYCQKVRDEGHQLDGPICVKCNSVQDYVKDLVISRVQGDKHFVPDDRNLLTPHIIRQAAEAMKKFGDFSVKIEPEKGHYESYEETVCVYDDPNYGQNNVDYSQYETVNHSKWIVDKSRALLILPPPNDKKSF